MLEFELTTPQKLMKGLVGMIAGLIATQVAEDLFDKVIQRRMEQKAAITNTEA